ncbi:MAG: metallophosphoesterase [candidate division WOR-3 bacterium]|nr:metallophosphoesterase [candidate division WOR-3 bacterium]MCX7947117.1 metallophosphoesterase [candidate division WOR-3 bacterium]MDW8149842.1 metallophosphoesterase family protein [candidate division WOR-3 bacterium]
MRIIILSDTHIPFRAKSLPKIIYEEIENSDMIIHAGDFVIADVYNELKTLKPIVAVYGNMDEVKLLDILKEVEVFEIERFKFGLFHGLGPPVGLKERVIQKLKNYSENFDVIIFGHSHIAYYKYENGIHVVNPGSPTDTFLGHKRTYAILEIKNNTIKVEIKEVV